jgi:hypothetical protein
MPIGSSDCGNGTHCPPGEVCGATGCKGGLYTGPLCPGSSRRCRAGERCNPYTGNCLDRFSKLCGRHVCHVAATCGELGRCLNIGQRVAQTDEPGVWDASGEHFSERAARYQQQITGGTTDQAYYVDGVKFDGFNGDALLEAKGPGYANFVGDDGEFKDFVLTEHKFLDQAIRQDKAAGGLPIEWHIAERKAYDAMNKLFDDAAIFTLTHIKLFLTSPVD